MLTKLKLIHQVEIELLVQKTDFVKRLSEQVTPGKIGYFAEMLDGFAFRNKQEYRGEVTLDGFKIKKRKKMFDTSMNLAQATGTYVQKDEKLLLNIEINGFSRLMVPYYLFCLLIYLFFFVGYFTVDEIGGNFPSLFLPFIIIHALFMLGLPYILMRRSMKKLTYDLEREFVYLTK